MDDRRSIGRPYALRLARLAIGLATGIGFIWLLLRNVDVAEVLPLVRRSSPAWLLAALAALALDFLVRTFRFIVMLRTATRSSLTLRSSLGPYLASFCVNNVLPFRAGDGFRLVWFTSQFGLSSGAVLGIMLVERFLDLSMLLLAGSLALAAVPASEQTATLFTSISCGLAAIFALAIGLLSLPAPLQRLTRHLAARTSSAWAIALAGLFDATFRAILMVSSPGQLLRLVVLSIACWAAEALVFVFTWLSMGGGSDFLTAPLLGFALGTLATLIPSLPGHFGPFDYFAVQGFSIAGAPPELSTGVVLLIHLVLWLPTTLAGMIWLVNMPTPQGRATASSTK